MAGKGKGFGGKKNGRKKGDPNNRGRGGKSPKQFMNALVPAGPRVDHDAKPVEVEILDADFTIKAEQVDPVDFCLAVINGDQEVLMRLGLPVVPDLDQRLEAARIAAPYTNKKKPIETVSKHQFSWLDEISKAEKRATGLRMEVKEDEFAPDAVN